MDGNCNIITEILLVISYTSYCKSNIITVTKLLVTSLLPNSVHRYFNRAQIDNNAIDYNTNGAYAAEVRGVTFRRALGQLTNLSPSRISEGGAS